MNKKIDNNEIFEHAHMVILISFTLFSIALICESILMKWEVWAIILVIAALIVSWVLHIGSILSTTARMWLYSFLMMAVYFFYGTHLTSTFDIAAVITVVMIVYIMTGQKKLILECMISYYITMAYDVIAYLVNGYKFDSLEISRIMLHLFIVALAGFVARMVIDKWGSVLGKSEERVEELADATNRLNDFLANVSHEIRTPINAIMGLTGVCLENEKDEEIKNEMIAVRGAGHRISEQVNDILDYSEVDKGELAINKENYMIQSVLNDIIVETETIREPGIELIVNVDPTMPSIMNTDITKLKRIIWHMVCNGLKYTKKGGVNVQVYAKKQEYGVNLCIDVTDTGKGMEARELERIFEGFYQGDSSRTRSSNGLGLGLSIAEGFTRALGGFMKVESKPNVGTTVSVSIPQAVVDATPCMKVENPDKIVAVGYLHFEKFTVPAIRDYYDSAIKSIMGEFGLSLRRVNNLNDLKRIISSVEATHLFVGPEEYVSDPEYFEEVAKHTLVCLTAEKDFPLLANSRVYLLAKPLFNFSIVTALNKTVEDAFEEDTKIMLYDVKTLVVDDEPMNLEVARMVFGKYGMRVTCAESGARAIDYCRNEQFDVVFMDHMMPEMDGVEAMKNIRAMYKTSGVDVPIVALTANTVSTAKDMFMKEGFDGFVSKPIEIPELERVMKNVIPKNRITFERMTRIDAVKKEIDEIKEEISSAKEEMFGEAEAEISQEPVVAEKDEESIFDKLNAIGIDTKLGLKYSQNDEEFYLALLKEYADVPDKKIRELEKYLEENDLQNYAVRTHAVKSTSKMIGIMDLSEMAKTLEFAAKEEDVEKIDAVHTVFIEEYSEMMRDINRICGYSPAVDSGGTTSDAGAEEEIFEFMPEGDE
ncbi:MAG: response regulator [Eubacterium sp.]|nr:response regulator [Eubacterium sp.]